MSDEKKQLSKARQALVDRVLSRLDEGAMPWDNGMRGASAPCNAISGKHYRGMNILNLMLAFKQDPRWLTFNQAKDNGYTVKKGAKGVPIELYKIFDKRTGKDADLNKIRDEIKDMTFEERQEFKKENLQTFARSYYVFNASDVHGIEPYIPKELTPTDISARNERIENVISNSQAHIYYDGNGRNYYDMAVDEIHLTDRAAFTSDEFFYNTALHEMAHSTGHSSRLNRKIGDGFGSKSYAREELVAEISSVLTAAEFGLDHSDRIIENSAEYVRSWAQLIRDDPQTLIDATFDASKATDYVCGMEQQIEHTHKTQKETSQQSTSALYSRYAALQDKYKDAIVFMRVGDFYEVIGEKARAASDELGLTLTSRDVGLPERTPMCGIPYHVIEQYTEKILEKHSVVIAENDNIEKYISSHVAAQKTPLESLVEKRTQKERLHSSVKQWYSQKYPTDELADELDEKTTFDDVRHAILDGKDIYTTLGGSADSVVRERVFHELAYVLDVSYGAVYNDWIENTEAPETRLERQGRVRRQDFPRDFASEELLDAADDFAQHTPHYGVSTETPKTPHKLKTDIDNIPGAMKALPNWVAFRTETVDGKVKKILLSPNKGASDVKYLKWAKSDDPATWASFDKAAAFATKYKLDGLAFSMSGSGMTCIDLDHCLDERGEPNGLAKKFIAAADNTYIEQSVSGRGLHIFYAGSRPNDRQNRNIELDIEVYDEKRFISMTGNYNGCDEINAPGAELDNLLKSNLPKRQQHIAPSAPLGLDDRELIEKIRSSKVGHDFDALMSGQILTYKSNGEPDHSTSDFKLCNMLAFFSGGDAAQVERIFRSSGLFRPEKSDAYVKRTAEKACATLTRKYEPKKQSISKRGAHRSSESSNPGR